MSKSRTLYSCIYFFLGKNVQESTGSVLSIDRDFFYPIEACFCIRNADFSQKTTRNKILDILGDRKVEVMLSDMAPNATGHSEMDHEQIVDLVTHFVEFASDILVEQGTLLCKLWEGGRKRHFQSFLQTLFSDVKTIKPDSSRSNSAEIFMLARGYKNPRDQT